MLRISGAFARLAQRLVSLADLEAGKIDLTYNFASHEAAGLVHQGHKK
jgi:hypothetical protein